MDSVHVILLLLYQGTLPVVQAMKGCRSYLPSIVMYNIIHVLVIVLLLVIVLMVVALFVIGHFNYTVRSIVFQ